MNMNNNYFFVYTRFITKLAFKNIQLLTNFIFKFEILTRAFPFKFEASS